MSTQQETNKAVVARFNKEFIEGRDKNIFDQTLHPDFASKTPHVYPAGGKDNVENEWNTIHAALPDLAVTIDDQVAEGDRVVTRKTFRGTHKGSFRGESPTGRAVEFPVIDIARLEGGRIVEHWAVADVASLLAQLAGTDLAGVSAKVLGQ